MGRLLHPGASSTVLLGAQAFLLMGNEPVVILKRIRKQTKRSSVQSLAASATVFLFALLLVAGNEGAAANSTGESATDYVQPIVTRVQFQELLESIDLDRDQKLIATTLFSDYASIIDMAVEMANELAVEAGRDTVEAVLAGRLRLPADELRATRANVLQAYTTVWPAVDAALEHLLDGTQALLTTNQSRQAEPAFRKLRRDIYLSAAKLQRFSSEYAGEGVCILDLAHEAASDNQELANIDRQQLQSMLDQYEQQLDAMLPDLASKSRSASVERRIASIQRDVRAQRTAAARLLQPWQQQYQLNRRTAVAIARLVPDAADKQAWMDRFHRACFPWLLSDQLPDRQYQWLAQQTLSEPTWAQIETGYELFTKQRRVLSESMIELIVEARLTLAVPMHPMMDPTGVPDDATEVYEQMIRITGEQKAARSQVREAFNAALNHTQRKAMKRAVR